MRKVRCFCALCGLGLLLLAGCKTQTEEPFTKIPTEAPSPTGTAERLPEEKRISIAVGDNYAAYLDEEGGLHILYAPEELMESVDLEKKYAALGTDPSTLVTIDEEGRLWAWYHSTIEECSGQAFL